MEGVGRCGEGKGGRGTEGHGRVGGMEVVGNVIFALTVRFKRFEAM